MFMLPRNCYRILRIGVSKRPSQLISTVHLSSVSEPLPKNKEDRRISGLKSSVNTSGLFVGRISNAKQGDLKAFDGDPDVFGTLSVLPLKTSLDEENEFDSDDLLEKEHLENPPDPSKKLRTKQYADMIKQHLRDKNLPEAIKVLEERMLKQDRVKPESYIYNLLIGACGRTGHAKQAFHLYNQMKKRSLKITGGTYTGLFNACATSFYPKDGLKRANNLRQLMIEKGYQPNVSNYNAMIKAYGHCGDLSTAFVLVDEMIDQNYKIGNDTFNFLLHACISDKDAGFRHALLVWRKMRDFKIKPIVYSYNLMLRACSDCGLGETQVTHDLLQTITNPQQQLTSGRETKVKNSQEINTSSYIDISPKDLQNSKETVSTLNKEEDERDLSKALEGDVFTVPEEETYPLVELPSLAPSDVAHAGWPNLLSERPRLGSVVSVSDVTSEQDRFLLLGGCSEFLDEMTRDGVEPNIKTFTQLLALIPSTLTAEKDLLRAMKERGIPRDIAFYNMLIKKRSLQGDYRGAKDVLSLVSSERLLPDIMTYGVLALGCTRRTHAMELLADLEKAGFRVNAEVLGALLRQACCHYNFGYALEMMETAQKEEVELNARFYGHLDTFYRRCRQVLYDKELGRPYPKFIDGDYFRSSFKIFSARYKSWLQETQTEPPDLKRDRSSTESRGK